MTKSPSPAAPLLAWFDRNKRILPFRQNKTPYRVWVSEIMLQQTRVSAALPYYERFMAELPDVRALADCEPDRLAKLWEGLGYYSRARNLQKAARIIVDEYGGELPADAALLRKLPGIGDYTAGAIASLAFGLPEPAVDGNVLRVWSRLSNDASDVTLPETKRRMTAEVRAAQPQDRPGDFNEALMELGALVCIPNGAPLCGECPLQSRCEGYKAGTAPGLPVKPAKKPRRTEDWTLGVVLFEDGVLLEKRPDTGLLAGLWQPAMFPGTLGAEEIEKRLGAQGVVAHAERALKPARHIFSHVEWHMTGYLLRAERFSPPYEPTTRAQLESERALPGAFKSVRAVLEKVL